MDIKDILNLPLNEQVETLLTKQISVPNWGGLGGLVNEYDPKLHPVNNRQKYPDIIRPNGVVEKVSRIALPYQKLAVRRMSELIVGLPVQRVYKSDTPAQAEIADIIENIYQSNRINALNIERANLLYAGCEVVTLWYAVQSPNNLYGFDSNIKIKCRNYSPIKGEELFPLFDENGDLIALSIRTSTKQKDNKLLFNVDTYTATEHIIYQKTEGEENWQEIEREQIIIGKIPAVYMYRPTPIWEETSAIVYEMEWALSRNGNYLRANSRPLFGLFTDEVVQYGSENDVNTDFRGILQFPKDAQARYITWEQAVENLKFYIGELRQAFFTQLQLPDWSFETMKATPMSGESRKQLFIDCQLKVLDESGRLIEFFDRELNVIKAFLSQILPGKAKDIEALQVETIITPYQLTDEKDKIDNLLRANGNKPLISQKQSINYLGWSDDVDKTLEEIREEAKGDSIELAE